MHDAEYKAEAIENIDIIGMFFILYSIFFQYRNSLVSVSFFLYFYLPLFLNFPVSKRFLTKFAKSRCHYIFRG